MRHFYEKISPPPPLFLSDAIFEDFFAKYLNYCKILGLITEHVQELVQHCTFCAGAQLSALGKIFINFSN
jgi:hypothetical protein